MINTSKEYKKAVKEGREFLILDEITFKNKKVMKLSTGDFLSYSINGATSGNGKFEIGAAVIKQYKAVLNNSEGKFNGYDFEGADIWARIGLKLANGTTEVIRKGTYRVCSAKAMDLTISIEAYDYMLFLDKPYSKSTLKYPATINQIIADVCLNCQLTYKAQSIGNGSYKVEKRPTDEALTFRDIISYCAQIMCKYARINNDDVLEFGWYNAETLEETGLDGGFFDVGLGITQESTADGGNFTSYTTGTVFDAGGFDMQDGFFHLYDLSSQNINTEDIVITGVKVVSDTGDSKTTESYLYGKEGYVLSIEKNPLIQKKKTGNTASDVATYIGARIVGRRFRPLSVSCQTDPAIEEGDVAYVSDRKNHTYKTLITNTTFVFGGSQSITCDAETPTEKEYTRYGAETKLLAQAKKDTQEQITQYDLVAQQFGNLMANGMGLYRTQEEKDGAFIYYLHDKKLLADSKTIWKMTEGAFAVSTDGGKTWNGGMDKNGNVLTTILTAIGINFDWAKGGTLTLGGANNVSGLMQVLDAKGNVITTINKDGVTVDKGTISGTKINGGTITGTTVNGSTVNIGGTGNVSGALNIKDADGASIATMNKNGVSINKGSIKGTNIIAGGSANKYGEITVRDSGGKTIVRADEDGIQINKGSVSLISKNWMDKTTLSIEQLDSAFSLYANNGRLSIGGNSSSVNLYSYATSSGCTGISVVENLSRTHIDAHAITTPSLFANDVISYGDLYASADLTVHGKKSRIARTHNYGDKLLYCYEMPSPMFGDIGEGFTDENGECYIFLNDIFGETITTTIEYQVFLQKEGSGDIWVKEKTATHFVIKGTPGLKFGWEIKAKQKEYEFEYLECFDENKENFKDRDYAVEAAMMVENYYKELEDMYSEEIN